MKIIKRLILAAGFLTMVVLLWKFDPHAVWTQVSQIGWGFALILPLQIITLIFRALGYSAASGLAFGLIRHIREILWASFGLLLYSTHHKQRDQPAGELPAVSFRDRQSALTKTTTSIIVTTDGAHPS